MKKVKRLLFLNIMIMIFCSVTFLWIGCADSGGGGGDTPKITIKLPDTGQTTCYDADGNVIRDASEDAYCPAAGESLAQDGTYPRNPQSFIDNSDDTITDDNTHLMWQKHGDATVDTWLDAGTYCSNLSFAGYEDWRLPHIKELSTIVNHGKFDPATSDVFSSNSDLYSYWSSTPHVTILSRACRMYLLYGTVSQVNHSEDGSVRCVRSGNESNIWLLDFSEIGSGVISHGSTGLMWQKEDDSSTRTWAESLAYCEDSTSDSYDDWRLPNVSELQTIVDYDKLGPAIDEKYFPNTQNTYYWSSTSHARFPGSAFYVNFYGGSIGDRGKDRYYYARCVRGGR